MVRFYTGVLSPSDYGTADLIMQTANLLIPIASLGITNGVFRFALDRVSQRKTVFTGGLITIVLGSAVLLLACPLLSYSSSLKEYAVLICAYTLASNLHSLCAQYVRAEGKTGLFALQGILNTALVIFFNILFLLFFKLGVLGYVMSVVAADGLCTLYLVLHEKLWTVCTPDPEKPLWKSMLRYSIPLIPTTIFWWITSVSDRYMIAYFLGTEANGLYAVACKIPTVLTLLSTIFLEAWQFSAIEEATGRPGGTYPVLRSGLERFSLRHGHGGQRPHRPVPGRDSAALCRPATLKPGNMCRCSALPWSSPPLPPSWEACMWSRKRAVSPSGPPCGGLWPTSS